MYSAWIQDSYPKKEWSDCALPDSIAMFAFPQDVHLESTKPDEVLSTEHLLLLNALKEKPKTEPGDIPKPVWFSSSACDSLQVRVILFKCL